MQGRIAKATAAALALTALSGLADGATAAAGGGGWTLRATPGASVDRPRDGASPWVFTTGPTHQLAQIARRLPSSGSTVVVARVERIAVRRALRPRAIVTVGAPGRPQVQVGVAARKGALRWAVWSGSGRPHVLSVRAGRPATLAVAAGPRGASVAVGGRTVFRSRAPFVRGVDRGRVALGPGPGKSAARVALSALRVRKGTLGAPGRITPRSRTAPASSPKAAPSPILLGAEDRPYDPGFAFNQPIPAGVASDARSAAIVGQLDENTEVSKAMMSASGEVPTVYVAKSTDPFYSVSVGGVSTRFRVPAGTVIGTGSDSPLVILDPSHPDHGRHTELRLWQASISGSTLSASGSGLFHYNNDGALLNPNGSRSLSVPFRGAGTGSGMSIMAGLIRPADIRAGRITHALRFAYSARDFTSRYRAPAVKTDQPNNTTTRNSATAMDMGMRLQLDPAVDCSARTVPGKASSSPETRYLRMVCVALQDYGMIVIDGTVDRGLLFQMEDDRTAGWSNLVGEMRYGSYGWLVRDSGSPSDGLARDATSGIPWHRLRVLERSVF